MGGTCCFGGLTLSQGSYTIAVLDIIAAIGVFFVAVHRLAVGVGGFYHSKVLIALGSVGVTLDLGYLIACSFLVNGFRKTSPRLCKPWLVINYIFSVLFGLGVVAVFLYFMVSYPSPSPFLLLIVGGGVFFLRVYLICVVQDFVDEIKRILG